MSFTLHRLDRKEIINELKWLTARLLCEKSDIVVMNPSGKTTVVKVEEHDNGIFLLPFESDSPFIKMAPMMGSSMHELSVSELIAQLERMTSDDVYLQWPKPDPRTVVGKILGFKVGEKLTVTLTPVPYNIEDINREVHEMVMRECKSARDRGLECGDCTWCDECLILRKADAAIKKKYESS